MSKILKPRRGSRSVMSTTKASTVLAAGEIFFESNGTIGASKNCGLKMGDGSTAYADLPYFIDGDIANVEITSIADKSSVTSITSCLSDVTTGKTLGTVIGAMKQALSLTAQQFDDLYPVGSLYMSTNSTLPTLLIRLGTWTEITNGYFLKAIGNSGTVGETASVNTGGTAITVAQMPSHTHKVYPANNMTGGNMCYISSYSGYTGSGRYGSPTGSTDSQGSGQTHNHTPGAPASYGVHVWKRTA